MVKDKGKPLSLSVTTPGTHYANPSALKQLFINGTNLRPLNLEHISKSTLNGYE